MIELYCEYLSVQRIRQCVLIMSGTRFIVNPLKELLPINRCNTWSLSDWNVTRTHTDLVCKGTLNHLVKLAKWLTCAVKTYLYGEFDCVFLSYHLRD